MNEFIQAWREHAKKTKKFNRAGMTLIEIMIVITLMAALMVVIGANVMGAMDRANVELTNTALGEFKSACKQYRVYYKKYPASLEDLIKTPDGNPLLDAEEVPRDAWDNEYNYERQGNKTIITSYGPDGQENTEDDIVIKF